MVDGEASTTWTCRAPEGRATFTLDLGVSRRFDRLVVFNRQTDQRGTGGGNNALKRFTLYVAQDDSVEQYSRIGEYSLEGPAAVCFKRKSGGQVCAFIDRKEPNVVELQVGEARYVKFEVEEAFWGEAAQESWRSSVAISEVMIFDSHDIAKTEAADTATRVTWEQVRTVLSEAMCAEIDSSDGDIFVTVISNDRHRCGATGESPLSRAIDRILRDAGLALEPLGIDPPFNDDATTVPEASRGVQAYYLSSDEFLRPILLRLPPELAKENLACADCARPASGPVRRVSWTEFYPYLAAHVWPDPVVTPRGPDGEPAGEPRYSFHMCAGLNGLGEMERPDHLLARAGFLAVMESPTLKERASIVFREIRHEEAFERLIDDAARTAYLRERVAEALDGDAVVKNAACETLQRRRNDLGLDVEECTFWDVSSAG